MQTLNRWLYSVLLANAVVANAAYADETVICNETGGDVELNFIYKRSVFYFSSEWEGSGPYGLPAGQCYSYFDVAQYYEVMLNVQAYGFFGGKGDLNVPQRGASIRTAGGKVEEINNLYCLNKVQNTVSYNEPLEFYEECDQENLAQFSVWMVRFVGDSIELTLR